MFKQSTFSVALAAAMSVTPAAFAADEIPTTETTPVEINFEKMDVNGDGFIRKNEFPTEASEGLDMTDFDRLDVNKDRKLSPDEINQKPTEHNVLDVITE